MNWLLLVAVFAVALLMVAGPFLRWRNRQLQMAQHAQKAFFRSAKILVEDPDTPTEVLSLVEMLSHELTNRKIVPKVFYWLLRGKGRQPTGRNHVHHMLSSMRTELQQHFMLTMSAGVIRITYNNAIFGTLVRRLALIGVDVTRARAQRESDSAETFVAFITDRTGNGGHCPEAA